MGFVLKYVLRSGSGRLNFRRAYPADLRPYVPNQPRELKVSLGHEGDDGLLGRYEQACRDYNDIIAQALRRKDGAFDVLDAPTIAYLAEAHRHQILAEDDEARYDPSDTDFFLQISQQLDIEGVGIKAGPFDEDPVGRWSYKQAETIKELRATCLNMRKRGDIRGLVDFWREDAELLCEDKGLFVSFDDIGSLRLLCRALNDAALKAWDEVLRRLEGEDVPTPPEPALECVDGAVDHSPALAREASVRAVTRHSGLSLLALYDDYAEAVGVLPTTRKEGSGHISNFCEHSGCDDAKGISTDMVFEWRNFLLNEERKGGRKRDPLTVRKYVSTLNACLNWAVQERKLAANVAKAVTVRAPKKVKLREREFTDEEAIAILSATLRPVIGNLSEGHAMARRWIPWVCAYTGARVNEISQLRAQDVAQVDGVWTIRITPEAGTVKTGEARIVPLHEHLVEQGFVAFAKSRIEGPLFYDPELQRVDGDGNRHVKKVGERLALWVRKEVGIVDTAIKPNHAWRHKFKSMAYEYGIEERVADAIQGHAPKSVGQSYGSVTVKAMALSLSKLPRFNVSAGCFGSEW